MEMTVRDDDVWYPELMRLLEAGYTCRVRLGDGRFKFQMTQAGARLAIGRPINKFKPADTTLHWNKLPKVLYPWIEIDRPMEGVPEPAPPSAQKPEFRALEPKVITESDVRKIRERTGSKLVFSDGEGEAVFRTKNGKYFLVRAEGDFYKQLRRYDDRPKNSK